MKYTYITDYKDNDKLRKSFNELTQKTFEFNFEAWYNSGFWREKYIPHSLTIDGRVIANVSANIMDFDMDGKRKHYVQIGTVMTDKDYRGQGLARYLMEKVIHEYKDRTDGIYLFCNDGVLNFYPKFGFTQSKEYQYSKNICSVDNVNKAEHVDISDKENLRRFLEAVENSISNDRFTMDNVGLIAFWTIGSKLVYYLPEEDAYIIASVKDKNVFIHQIIADHKVNLGKAASSFGSGIKKVTLGFTPYECCGYDVKELHEEDTTLFIMGRDLENIEMQKLMFPTLSHA